VNSPFAVAILSGSLLLAIPVALLAGFVSFLSPCVLPLVPGYLGYVTGLTGVDLQKQKRGRMLAGIGLFVLGFSVIFVLLGGAFGQLGTLITGSQNAWITQVLGLLVIIMGVVFMGGFGWGVRLADGGLGRSGLGLHRSVALAAAASGQRDERQETKCGATAHRSTLRESRAPNLIRDRSATA